MLNEAFRVKSGIKMPEMGCGNPGRGRNKYPFRSMKVGDSFLVPCGTDHGSEWDVEAAMNSLTSCIRNASYKTGWRFAMRTVPDGLRVWRVS